MFFIIIDTRNNRSTGDERLVGKCLIGAYEWLRGDASCGIPNSYEAKAFLMQLSIHHGVY